MKNLFLLIFPMVAYAGNDHEKEIVISWLEIVDSGKYVVVTLATNYEHKDTATETVTVTRDGNEWRVVGYFIK